MAGSVKWNGEAVRSAIHSEMRRRVTACCLIVANHAKQLLSVDGTGVARETEREAGMRHHKEALAKRKASVKDFNEKHKLGIGLGKIKKLRVTKAGTVSNRRKPRKKKRDGETQT